jgi:cytochrome bd-type quinol oxidase subunit 2
MRKKGWLLLECLGGMFVAVVLGILLPTVFLFLEMPNTMGDPADDSPGAGFLFMFIWLVGIIGGLAAGSALCGSILKCRDQTDKSGVRLTTIRALLGLVAFSLFPFVVPAVMMLPWAKDHTMRENSFAVSSILLFSLLFWLISRTYSRRVLSAQS